MCRTATRPTCQDTIRLACVTLSDQSNRTVDRTKPVLGYLLMTADLRHDLSAEAVQLIHLWTIQKYPRQLYQSTEGTVGRRC